MAELSLLQARDADAIKPAPVLRKKQRRIDRMLADIDQRLACGCFEWLQRTGPARNAGGRALHARRAVDALTKQIGVAVVTGILGDQVHQD